MPAIPFSQVAAEPAVCPLVYAELFTFANQIDDSQSATNGEAVVTGGRVDHIANKGRCGRKVADLTARVESAGDNDIGGLGPPFLVIFNFQVST